MHKTYVHPWYLALSKLESTTTCESELTLKQSKEMIGVPPTNAIHQKQKRDQIYEEEIEARGRTPKQT